MKKRSSELLSMFCLLLFDQLLKLFIRHNPNLMMSKFFSITFSKNTGALFGIFKNQSLTLAFLGLIIIGLILFFYDSLSKNFPEYVIDLIIVGLLSNMLDRFILGYVTDYLCFVFWPCFNLADSYVVVGVGLCLFELIRYKPHKK